MIRCSKLAVLVWCALPFTLTSATREVRGFLWLAWAAMCLSTSYRCSRPVLRSNMPCQCCNDVLRVLPHSWSQEIDQLQKYCSQIPVQSIQLVYNVESSWKMRYMKKKCTNPIIFAFRFISWFHFFKTFLELHCMPFYLHTHTVKQTLCYS